MAKNVVIRPSVREQYQKFMARGRVLFFTAPCGFGKSILAETLLAGQHVLSLTAWEPDFALPADDKDWQVLLIDDLRQMTEEPDQQALCQLIREYSDRPVRPAFPRGGAGLAHGLPVCRAYGSVGCRRPAL